MTPQELQDRLLYRDGLMLIIDKPAGLPVHAGPGGGPNLERHLDALRFGLPSPPALAHRLDRDTSGCLVLGRHRKALRRLGALFAAGAVEKVYWAVVAGIPAAASGRIELPLRKVTRKGGGWRMIVDRDAGQTAATDYRILGTDGTSAWLELRPRTGRTHQIRVHCAAGLGCPVLGDPIYGSGIAAGGAAAPLHLHARSIAVPLYPNRPPVTAEASPPPHMRAALARCGFTEEAFAAAATAGVTTAAPLR
ncbi:MAG TPA: RNA pseudouridine synthase [Stellaceae bacterium]|jgi:tRNA pseudouridine32 synthase/23S rRNA pseudouridine746 synthase/23S rRNA pseudouridine1911/1915/1917 synthase